MIAAGTLLGITAIRVRGRWIDRWFMIFMRYRGRARVRRAPCALGVVAPRLTTHEYRDPAGTVAGVLTDGPHWTVVLRLDGVDPAVNPVGAPYAVERMAHAERLIGVLQSAVDPAGEVRAPAVQLVRWAVPMPVDPEKPAGRGTGAPAPAWNVHWIAVRGQAPDATGRAGFANDAGFADADDAALKASPAAALRLAAILAAQGFAVRPLREAELSDELASSLGAAPAGGAVTAREGWWSLSLGRLHHATYRLTRPMRDPARLARALSWLAGPPALSTCASLLFTAPAGTSGNGIPAPAAAVVGTSIAASANAAAPSAAAAEARAVRRGARQDIAEVMVTLRIAVPAGRSRREVRGALRLALGPMVPHTRSMNGEHATGTLATIPLGRR